MPNQNRNELDGKYCPQFKCRWKTYTIYRLILWLWMMNDITTAFSAPEISHNGFYIHAVIHTLGAVFIGMPLLYSEICLVQYTNCNVVSMWDFFPFFRGVGYGSFFLIFLKVIYLMILTSWYLIYTFYSALESPPWYSCDDYNDTKCMVKRINVSIFQHCLETQNLFDDDCGMKTASNCFFEREIGNNNTMNWPYCIHPWKAIIASSSISIALFLLSIRKEKFIQVAVKLVAFYVCLVILVLFCVALSNNGTWYETKVTIKWTNYNFGNCFKSITRGFLSLGTGSGVINYLSRDTPFRSPVTMTSIAVPLYSVFITIMFAIIAFSGIKTMSYFHGEEQNVIEIGENIYFTQFASMSEIMSYFDALPVWGFAWFSTIFICLFSNLWILYLYIKEILINNSCTQKYNNICFLSLIIFLSILSCPLFCSDLTSVLTDVTELIQILSSLFLSISLYWIYGYNNHNIDIIFMIGIKASYFYKIAWILNPILLIILLFTKWDNLYIYEYNNSYFINTVSIFSHVLLFYILMSIYFSIVTIGIVKELLAYYRFDKIQNSFLPTQNWGPRDKILFKSRKMFLPDIMTREFLYRQVRLHRYRRNQRDTNSKINESSSKEYDFE